MEGYSTPPLRNMLRRRRRREEKKFAECQYAAKTLFLSSSSSRAGEGGTFFSPSTLYLVTEPFVLSFLGWKRSTVQVLC